MTKKTKKRIGVIAMSLLLVGAVGATAGTTLARYISSTTVTSESATVAKWGFTMSMNADEMFGKGYGDVSGTPNTSNGYAHVSKKNDDKLVVKASGDYKVVAPGTTGKLTFTVSGSSEVNAVLSFNLSTLAESFKTVVLADGGEFAYYPIEWSVGGEVINPYDEDAKSYGEVTAASFEAGFQKAFKDYDVAVKENVVYVFIPAGESLDAVDLTISWKWDFGRGTDIDSATNEFNIKDTLLGFISNETTFDNLSGNVVDWLAKNYTKSTNADVVKATEAVTTAEGELNTANDNLTAYTSTYNAAVTKLGELQKAVDDLKEDIAFEELSIKEAKEVLARLASLGVETGETVETYKTMIAKAEEKLGEEKDAADENGKLYAQLKFAENALSVYESGEYATTKTEYDKRVKAVEDADKAVNDAKDAAVKAFYAALSGENTITEIDNFSLEATVAQTQLTQEEFKAVYGLDAKTQP